jgi:hypothetical protein
VSAVYKTAASPAMLDGHTRGLGARSHLVRRSGRNRISVARSTAGSSTIELQRRRTNAETSCRGAPCESRTRLSGLEDRVLTARTTVRAEAEDGIEPSRCRGCNPAPSHLATRPVAGCRGIEPRWPDLESSLIPDRCPARWRAGGSNSARVACKASLHPGALPVPASRFERESSESKAEMLPLAPCGIWGGRRDLNSLVRRSPRLGATLRPRPQSAQKKSNLRRPVIVRVLCH